MTDLGEIFPESAQNATKQGVSITMYKILCAEIGVYVIR
jgi:hypothetical protein